MNKKFFMGIAAMAALTLVSCSSDDLDSVSEPVGGINLAHT